MRFEDLNKDIVVFSYQTSPTFGAEGENGGFLLELMGNGNLKFARYKLFDEISHMKVFKLSRRETKEIFDWLNGTEHAWKEIPEELDNETTDRPGNINEFVFLDRKRIRAYNIRKTWIPGEMLKNRAYCRRHKENMKYENQVLYIFDGICRILKKKEILLTLRKCRISENCKVKVTWIDKTKAQPQSERAAE